MKNARYFHASLILSVAFVITLIVSPSSSLAQADKMDSIQKKNTFVMLENVKNAIKSDYYDVNPKFAGADLETRFNAAEEKLKTNESLGQAFAIIAQAVVDLNDSHAMFYPPARNAITEYGWRMSMYGDKAFITNIKQGSDADKKGLKIGDEVLKVNNFRPTRKELWKLLYYYEILSPKTNLTFEVKSPTGEVRQLQIATKIRELKKTLNLADSSDLQQMGVEADKNEGSITYFREIGDDDVLVWKLPTFSFDPKDVGGFIGRAKNKKTLILDLRGNGGGAVKTLEQLVGYFFDHDLKIADLKGRKPLDPQRAKTKGGDTIKGKLIVLVDANSASASEIFARTMQLEKRGTVLGDVSAGAVMQSKYKPFSLGVVTVFSYGMNLTMADVIMPDGKSLEHVGVIPDELILPTGQDLALRRDPVMARALELAGVKMDADVAGKFFPPDKFIEHVQNYSFYGNYYIDSERY